MHEVAALRAAVAGVLATARMHDAGRVREVRLLAGVSDHASEEVIRGLFEALVAGTAAEGARLAITWVPARLRCFGCGAGFDQAEPGPTPACPGCGGVALEEAHSDLLAVSEVELVVAPTR